MSSEDSIASAVAQPALESCTNNEANDLIFRARLLNAASPTFNQEALDSLKKAIKLNPHLTEAHLELSRCHERRPDIGAAIKCLDGALKYCDSGKFAKIIFRKLSTFIRQENCDSREAKIAALLRSLELSKQALELDLEDVESYYNLAKAYMCLFFATECVDQRLINLSRAAYVKALTLSGGCPQTDKASKESSDELIESPNHTKSNSIEDDEYVTPLAKQSDFFFNYSTVLVYLQDFQKALEYLRIAINIDPDWEEPKLLEDSLIDYLRQIYLMLNELQKSNKKLIRRYSRVVDTLKSVQKIEDIICLDQRRLLRSLDLKVKSLTLKDLESFEESPERTSLKFESESETRVDNIDGTQILTVRLLHVKLINFINYNQAMYLTFIAIDQNYSLIVVTIYNLAASRCPTPRDVVTIVEPKIERITVDSINLTKGNTKSKIMFKRINVREFKELYVNGYRITMNQVSRPEFKVSILP